jgi:hypothetical protein
MWRTRFIPHLDMLFFIQVPASSEIDAGSGGIMSFDDDVNAFVLLI